MRVGHISTPAIAAVTLSVVVLMSGCGPIRYDHPLPLSIRESDDGMEVAVCEPTSANRVYVGIRSAATGGEWLTLSDLEGSTEIQAESVFEVGQSLPGMSAVVDRTLRTPDEGADVNVNIMDEGGAGDDTLTVFFAAVPWGDLDGEWLFTDGGRSTDPCGHYQEWKSTH